MRHLYHLFLCFVPFVFLSATSYNIDSETTEDNSSYKGGLWITTAGDAAQPNQWLCFRHSFHTDTLPKVLKANIAVDSKYWLYINDSLVLREGGLKRAYNPDDTYYDEIDLAPYLKKGSNTIAVLLWYFGKSGFSHNNSGKAGLYFASHCEFFTLASDKNWRVMPHPAFYDTHGQTPNYRLAESNIGFDAQKDIADWYKITYDDSHWPEAEEIGYHPAKPWNDLLPRPIPQFYFSGLKDYDSIYQNEDTLVAILPYDAQICPYIAVRAKAGKTINIQTDIYRIGSKRHQSSIRAEYITNNDSLQHFESPAWMAGHEVHYTIPDDIEVVSVKYRESGYATQWDGHFSTDNAALNTLWQKAQRTLYINMRDNFFDCPERERALWVGDFVSEMGEVFYAFDTAAIALCRKSIKEIINWQRSDSTLFGPSPGIIRDELPHQMLSFVGYYGIWTYYQYTGEKSILYDTYPALKQYLSLWHIRQDGLVNKRQGEWYWVDWGNNKDERLLDNLWYALALKGLMNMSYEMNHKKDFVAYRQKYQALRQAINDSCWTGTAYRWPSYDGQTDDRANALAILSGIADTSRYDTIAQVLMNERHASPYMEKYVLEALFHIEQPELALKRMLERYSPMIESDYTTLWELWTYDKPSNTSSTYHHGWSGGPLTLMSQYLAGIEPLTPGFDYYQVCPKLVGTNRLQTELATVKGKIKLKVSFEEWQYLMELYSPPDTHAKVGIPKKYFKSKLKINGVMVNNKLDLKNRKISGAKYISQNDEYYFYVVEPGYWVFEIF